MNHPVQILVPPKLRFRTTEIHSVATPAAGFLPIAPEKDRVRFSYAFILTQDLDFSRIIAVSGESAPSLISLRLTSSRIEYVHSLLSRVLPDLEAQSLEGAIITVEDATIRRRSLPIR
jgi:hypothetical protein